MEEIKVGEYVRTIYGEIFKVVNLIKRNKDFVLVDRGVDRNQDRDENDSVLITNEITKHSKNIIELVEVGDYVNGYKIIKIDREERAVLYGYKDEDESRLWFIYEEDIKTIVTKEQFKSIEYEV